MASLNLRRDNPVERFVLLWTVAGVLLVSYGLYDVATYSCGATATGGCGGPFGFVLLLWGASLLGLAVVFFLGRLAYLHARGDTPSDG